MAQHQSLRGQPLGVLVMLVGSWIGLRAVTWEPPSWAADLVPNNRISVAGPQLAQAPQDPAFAGQVAPGMSVPMAGGYWTPVAPPPQWYTESAMMQPPPAWYMQQPALARATSTEPRPGHGAQEPLLAAGHQLMWMAALARVAVPPEIASYIGGQTAPAASAPVPLSPGLAAGTETAPNRWSADAWMLTRKQTPMSLASGRPLYGGSQIGAVLRYQLAPGSGHRPIAYLRGSSSLGMIRESEVAMGIGARPLANVPVMVAAEARAFRTGGSTNFRPAAIAYTELQPVDLPWDMTGEAYFQAGYVGGRYKTPFVDGQIRMDRPVMGLGKFGSGDLRLGGGLWGGAQKGANRLDAGPGATADLKLLGKPARVSMDYRFRIAGDAEPGSGPALTVSAGF